MKALLLALAFALQPMSPATEDRIDLVEVNHFYDDAGKLVFDQVIYFAWCDSACRHQVVAWRMVKREAQIPERVAVGSGTRREWRATWFDGEVLRRTRVGSVRETWTQFDPELDEREVLPMHERRELSK